MSRAETRAHEIYTSMQLGNVDDEVRRHLVILLSVPKQKKTIEPYTSEELLQHLEASSEAIKSGDVLSMEEAHSVMNRFASAL